MRRRLTGNTSPFLAFGTLAVTAFVLHQCDGDSKPVESVMYTSADECVASGRDQRLCLLSYQDAMRAHTANRAALPGHGILRSGIWQRPVYGAATDLLYPRPCRRRRPYRRDGSRQPFLFAQARSLQFPRKHQGR